MARLMIQAILFDLDGLMVDSEPHSIASWQAVLALRGANFDQALIDRAFGLRVDETSQLLKDAYHLPDSIADLAHEKIEYQVTHLNANVKPMPGLFELLDEIDRLHLKTAVASSGQRRYVDAVLASINISDRFDAIVAGDQVARGKPAPDVFLAAAHALNVEPQNCLVLEDAPAGVQAAKSANMMCIAIPNAHTRLLDLSRADQIVDSLADVQKFLNNSAEGVVRGA
jgi:HAD superfamily hydrolase (TIGR01509 family)